MKVLRVSVMWSAGVYSQNANPYCPDFPEACVLLVFQQTRRAAEYYFSARGLERDLFFFRFYTNRVCLFQMFTRCRHFNPHVVFFLLFMITRCMLPILFGLNDAGQISFDKTKKKNNVKKING